MPRKIRRIILISSDISQLLRTKTYLVSCFESQKLKPFKKTAFANIRIFFELNKCNQTSKTFKAISSALLP